MTDYKLKYPLREWQREALMKWEHGMRGIVRVVTGGGKTVFAEACTIRFFAKHHEGIVVIVVPTITLQDQWRSSLMDELGVDPIDINTPKGRLSGKWKRFNIVVINSARAGFPTGSNPPPTLLIVDECHRSGSAENSKALNRIGAVAHLGLSATPERQQDEGFTAHIEPALGPIIFRYGYDQALKDGVICEYVLINIKVPMSGAERADYEKHTLKVGRVAGAVKAGKVDVQQLKLALIARSRMATRVMSRLVTAALLARQHMGDRTIIFHEQIEGCDALNRSLRKAGINSASYHSKLGDEIRKSNLHEFRRGTFNTLITCRALDEGMNAPETTVAIIASSTTSTRQRIQRLGRVLRPHGKKTKATIYSLYCTESEELILKEEAAANPRIQVSWIERN